MYGAALAQEVFEKEMRALKVRGAVAGHWNLTTTSWEDHWSWSSYNYTRSYPRTQGQPFYGHLAFEANWKGEKVLISGCLMSWQQIKIIVVLKSCLLILCNNKPFLDWIVTCDEEWILYDNQQWPAQWLDREEAPEHFPKPKLHQKKGHGHCLVVCCPSGPLQLSESWRNHYIWELTLDCMSHNQTSKVEWMATKVPTLTDKDVFEPSYDDLKFMIRNHDHVCTNVIQMKNWC